jgi:hypothetical protein
VEKTIHNNFCFNERRNSNENELGRRSENDAVGAHYHISVERLHIRATNCAELFIPVTERSPPSRQEGRSDQQRRSRGTGTMALTNCQSLQKALACAIISMTFVEIAQASPIPEWNKKVWVVSMQEKTNEQVVGMLQSRDRELATQAVYEIMRRGEPMIPFLLRLKGDTRLFQGIAKAWEAVENWANELKKENLDSLRAKKFDPLKSSGVTFY